MTTHLRDDSALIAWAEEHPQAFILSTSRTPRRVPFGAIHRVTHPKWADTAGSTDKNPLTRNYHKFGADKLEALVAGYRLNQGAEPKICRCCQIPPVQLPPDFFELLRAYSRISQMWPPRCLPSNESGIELVVMALYRNFVDDRRQVKVAVVVGKGSSVTLTDQNITIKSGRKWPSVVHLLAHEFFNRLHPEAKERHSWSHLRLEEKMIKWVLHWLDRQH